MIFVTGGTGMIGSHAIEKLTARKHENELGWEPTTSPVNGLARSVRWHIANRS